MAQKRRKRPDWKRINEDAKMLNRRGPQRSAAHMAKMRAAKLAKVQAKPDILQFVTQDLGLQPSEHQATLLKAFYGLPLSEREKDIFTACTGRKEYSARPYTELTLVSGARSGKNALILTPVLLYEGLHGGFNVNRGESVVIPCIAQDSTAADISMRLVREYARKLGGKQVADETARKVVLKSGVEFRLFPCTSKSVYGFAICGAGLDEVGRFKFSGSDTDEDIEAGVLRGMGQFGNRAKLVKVSTPAGKAGVLWRDFERSWGRDDPHRLVWRSTSAEMAPGINAPEFLQRMRDTMDPVRYARLFEADFSDDASVFLSADVVDRATDRGCLHRRREDFPPNTRFVAFADPAGHGRDEFTLAVVAVLGRGSERRFVHAAMHVCPKGDTESMARSCVAVLRAYGLSKVHGDRATGGWVLDAFKRNGAAYEYPHLRRDERNVGRELQDKHVYASRSLLYLEFSPIIRSGAVRLLDDPLLRRQLTNLEQTGERVEPGPMHDDRANAVAGAVVVAMGSVTGMPRPWAGDVNRLRDPGSAQDVGGVTDIEPRRRGNRVANTGYARVAGQAAWITTRYGWR